MKKLLIGLMLTIPMVGSAIEISLTNVNCGTTGAACTALQQEILDTANADIPDVSIDDYGTGIANSTAFAMTGQGSDYTDNFDLFTFKVSGGAAVDGDLADIESADGFGLGAAATIGLNLDVLPVDKIAGVELKNFDIFFSVFSYELDQEIEDLTLEGKTNSLGFHVRWRFIDPSDIVPGYMVHWGGVQLHTGIQRNTLDIEASQSFEDQTATAGGETATFGNSSATFNIESATTTIPVEISTNIRLLYVFTFYAGAGFDLVSGKTDADLTASGTVSGTNSFSAQLTASESGSGDADATNFRAFLGTQFNIPLVKVYVHANKSLGSDLLGVNAGVKLTW